ncbi:MAG: 2-C-methyl-D-erythritol 2,4-cyclodiphosphate synthase [Christensenellales bacterium]|jgi:2-C-methyl-D-erythritol 4-phosphate cytidylyltransferase/2-C-methyl-D-erythritol 2,4-cyclodiphosphate synthase
MSNCDVIVLAAGSGSRAGADKMLFSLTEDTVAERAAGAFAVLDFVEKIIIAASADNIERIKNIFADFPLKPIEIVEGGATRHLSVKAALERATSPLVLIHDGARPFVSAELIQRVYEKTLAEGSAVPALPPVDSIREIREGKITGAPNRAKLWRVQTPQGYLTRAIKGAFEKARRQDYTDESELYLETVSAPCVVDGEEANSKVTTLSDLLQSNTRIGLGWDLHKLKQGLPLVICGVRVPYTHGLEAHSDGDVAAHAVIDSLLSAAGLPDIGHFFPDSDAAYQGADSMELLGKINKKISGLNYKINNLVVLIIADKPRLAPYAEQMKARLAQVLGIKKERLALHFKTSEGTHPAHTVQCFSLCNLL